MKKIFTTLLALAVVASPFLANAATTVVVSGDTSAGENLPGWMFNRDTSTDTPFEFNTNAASIGTGSLYVLPIGTTSADKFIAENFLNTAIADVNSISYDFMIGSTSSSTMEEQFYMNVYANFGTSTDTKFYDCRYDIVPTTGSTTDFTTVTFDPTQAYPVTQSGTAPFACPAVPADMDLVDTSASSTIRAFALNVGDTSATDAGLSGYLDNVVTDLAADVVTYDFEPADLDADDDGVNDAVDNCPLVANADQANADGDTEGDLCDLDDDNDTVVDTNDNCPLVANAGQEDADGDGIGDVCETDDDNDGIADADDLCPATEADEFESFGHANGRYMWDGTQWVSTAKGANGFAPTAEMTHGCSGTQILEQMGIEEGGQFKFGITKGTIEEWLEGLEA